MSGVYEQQEEQKASATDTFGDASGEQKPSVADGLVAAEETKATIDGWWKASWPGDTATVVAGSEAEVKEIITKAYRLDSHIPIDCVPATQLPRAGEDAIYKEGAAILRGGVQDIPDWLARCGRS